MEIRFCTRLDAAAICEIYNHYVETSVVTFEEKLVTCSEMESRIAGTSKQFPWLVAQVDQDIVGYAYATAWKPRSAYRHSVETTVYLRNSQKGKGLGFMLYRRLIDELRQQNFHCLIAGISLPNEASIRLHEKLGFEKVAHFKQVGRKFERWIDVGYWQLVLNEKQC